MSKKPIVILQTLRMGDIILSFPLMLWLSRVYPGHPVWVVAEEIFYKPLMSVGPDVTYFGWNDESLKYLRSQTFYLTINLSHDARAARLNHDLSADEKIGPVESADGDRYVRGAWQLYRTTLVGGNRHNLFHWADLNALDVIPLSELRDVTWPEPRILSPDAQKGIGLFLGASEPEKRPDAAFWSALGQQLLDRGLRPVLLGGPGEEDIAREVAAQLPSHILNLAGKLKLSDFAKLGQAVGLMVTPDTGPMHLAAWSGLRTLNLSMGNVSAWETGPYQPGHYVLRSRSSCVGCWECTRGSISCKQRMSPKTVAFITHQLATRGDARLTRAGLYGLHLSRVGRTADGLYTLDPVRRGEKPSARDLVGRFWRAFWGHRFGLWDIVPAEAAYGDIALSYPQLRAAMAAAVADFGRDMKPALKYGRDGLERGFWKASIPAILPLRSWCQMHLGNSDWSREALRDCLEAAEMLIGIDEAHR